MTERLFAIDPYLLDFEASVQARREHEGRPAVVLDRTAFYAESGGQPWDTGTLGEARVVAVLVDGDDILHVLDRRLDEARVQGHVDGERRRDHRQQHHGQHLLSRAFVEVAAAATTSFHLGAELITIDLDRLVTDAQTRAAEARANEVVWEARPVRVRTVTATEVKALGLVPPPGAEHGIRLVEAEGFDLQPCGGTHPRSTAEVGVILVTATERYKGGTRVSFVCGHRALAAVRRRQAVLDRLSALLSAPLDGLVEETERTREALAASERRGKELLARALDGEARRLLAEAGAGASGVAVVVAAYEGWPPEELRTLASRLVVLSPSVALLGSRADKAHLVFARSEGLSHDMPALLRPAVETLGGRGGGRANMAQGGGERVERLDEVLARAAAAVRGVT